MNVTPEDRKKELFVINAARKVFPIWEDLKFIQNKEDSAIFDFNGYYFTHRIDVKVRDVRSDQFPDAFISKEKIEQIKLEPHILHYIIYFYTVDRKAHIFCIEKSKITPKMLSFKHKRTGEDMTQLVYTIRAEDAEFTFDL